MILNIAVLQLIFFKKKKKTRDKWTSLRRKTYKPVKGPKPKSPTHRLIPSSSARSAAWPPHTYTHTAAIAGSSPTSLSFSSSPLVGAPPTRVRRSSPPPVTSAHRQLVLLPHRRLPSTVHRSSSPTGDLCSRRGFFPHAVWL